VPPVAAVWDRIVYRSTIVHLFVLDFGLVVVVTHVQLVLQRKDVAKEELSIIQMELAVNVNAITIGEEIIAMFAHWIAPMEHQTPIVVRVFVLLHIPLLQIVLNVIAIRCVMVMVLLQMILVAMHAHVTILVLMQQIFAVLAISIVVQMVHPMKPRAKTVFAMILGIRMPTPLVLLVHLPAKTEAVNQMISVKVVLVLMDGVARIAVFVTLTQNVFSVTIMAT
jgi:hypothetical protein